jgi:periplasmic protein TonB
MTNNEILRATLLDIIFENRNKAYGAYALRRTYNNRLVMAMIAASAAILLFIFLTSMRNRKSDITASSQHPGETVKVTPVVFMPDKPKQQPAQDQSKPKPAATVASQHLNSQIAIVPDDQHKAKVPANADLDSSMISDVTGPGKPPGDIPILPAGNGNGNNTTSTQGQVQGNFIPDEQPAEYPGGDKALGKFISEHLVTPADLEPGEKKTVMVKFKVDTDGSVSQFEITVSGGQEFDREVIRVCRKMARWKPARQNGVTVPVSFQIPVTFIGFEQ